MNKIGEIRQRWEILQDKFPAPWQWYGNTKVKQIHLATVRSGHVFIMTFDRWGMQSAQPLFQVHTDSGAGIMKEASELVRYDVAPVIGESNAKGNGSVYRHDFTGIDHPAATAIAAAPTDIKALLDEIDQLQATIEHAERSISLVADSLSLSSFAQGMKCEMADDLNAACAELRRVIGVERKTKVEVIHD